VNAFLLTRDHLNTKNVNALLLLKIAFPFLKKMNYTIVNANLLQELFAELAQAQLPSIVVTMLMKLAKNNAEPNFHARARKEFASLQKVAVANLSQRKNAQLTKTLEHASRPNTIHATRDVLLLPVAILFLAKMLDKNVALVQSLLFVINSLLISNNMNNVLKRKPKDVSLMNSQPARRHVVCSNIEANVTTLQK
jgi:hypothetical protein